MQVGPVVVGLPVSGAVANKKNVKFGSYNPNAARKIEQEIARNGIKCNMKGNDFLAECCNKTINVFDFQEYKDLILQISNPDLMNQYEELLDLYA